ncbi:MAG: hypothetical protein ACREFX_00685 [Opitutaceae bacterium]
MSILAATLIPGLILLALGTPLLVRSAGAIAALRAFPRSKSATYILFGGGAAWFLGQVWNLSTADFGKYHIPLFIGFALIAILAFRCVPDFLAVRGLAIVVLLGASPLLMASYLKFDVPGLYPRIYFQSILVYVAIGLAVWLGAQPWRLRDFLEWVFARESRTRWAGGLLTAYGVLLAVLAFTF